MKEKMMLNDNQIKLIVSVVKKHDFILLLDVTKETGICMSSYNGKKEIIRETVSCLNKMTELSEGENDDYLSIVF